MNPHDPRHIPVDIPRNPAGTHYTTAAGDIEPATVEYVIELLNKTVGNPHQTVSKDKLKHIAAQLLARNAMVERNNDVLIARVYALEAEVARLQPTLANITSVTLDTNNLTEEQRSAFGEQIRNSLSVARDLLTTPGER